LVNDPILLIFDIDGTLTDSGGLTRVALEMAAKELYGVERSTAGISAWGQTDLKIFKLMVDNNRLPVADVEVEFKSFAVRYIQTLSEILYKSDKPRLHTGIRALLERLASEPDIKLAIGTGNIEPTARLKLERHGVSGHFPIGGFGSDSADRASLLQVALDRSRQFYGASFPVGSYWVIGDTPNDIFSGKKIAAETVAVCTGAYRSEELARHRPTAVLSDLSDADYFLALVRREIEPASGQIDLLEKASFGEEPDPI